MRTEIHQRGRLHRSLPARVLVLGGAAILAACAPAVQGPGDPAGAAAARPGIGVQLYTVRDQLGQDFEGTLRKVAEAGYREFEFAGYGNRSPEQVRALLDRLGVRAPSAHIGLDAFRKDLPGVLAAAKAMGHEYVVIPSIPPSERTVEGYRRLAAEFNRYGAAARQQGLRFAYHNHAFEFEPLEGGRTGYDILLAETDPQLVDMELDLYWAVKAGRDPVELFQRHPGRFALWHVKDMKDLRGAQTMVPVGQGEIDFARIFAHAPQAGMRYFFVEHDTAAQWPAGSLASIQSSYQYLSRLLR